MGEGKYRNILCWCGSGKKYKHCHLGRFESPPVPLNEMYQATKRIKTRPDCMHPDAGPNSCRGGAISAHTLSLASSLNAIARDSKVYAWNPQLPLAIRNRRKEWSPKLVATRAASTISGFCKKHDQELFSPLENEPISLRPEQIFLLGFRAIAREYYLKRSQLESLPLQRKADAGRPYNWQKLWQERLDAFQVGLKIGLRDLGQEKSLWDEIYRTGDFGRVQSLIVTTDRVPDVICSGAWGPQIDADHVILQDYPRLTAPLQYITMSSIPTNSGGAVIFSWLRGSLVCERFIESLSSIDDAVFPDALVKLVFWRIENMYLRPAWWESLSISDQDELIRIFVSDIQYYPLPPDGWLDTRNVSYVSWAITSRISQ